MQKKDLTHIILEETRGLPTKALDEILHYIRFMKTKKLGIQSMQTSETKPADDLFDSDKTSLANLEQEFLNYKKSYSEKRRPKNRP